jgi:osmotically-inducible protein OsmY
MEGNMKSTLLGALAIVITTNVGVAMANDNDDRLEDKIEARFNHDTKLKGHDVRVDVEDGVATLKGKVPDQAHKVRAERLARVAGVTKVEDKLEIDTSSAKNRIEDDARMEKKRIDDRAEKAKDRVDDNADRAKDRLDTKATEAKERAEHPAPEHRAPVERPNKKDTVGDEVTDSWITTKVKAQFLGVDALKGSDISVDTNQNGLVTLTGTVPNERARARAVEIVRTTKGVRKVVDEMKSRP